MKHLILSLACLIISTCVSAKPVTIVPEGVSTYSIILSDMASPSEIRGAKELKQFLFEMTGARLPIKNDTSNPPEKCIIIGHSKALTSILPDFDLSSFGDEEYIIKTIGERLIIAGGKQRGTMYGVYGLLHDLGCRWYTPDASYIPKVTSIIIPETDLRDKPVFEYRDPYWFHAFNRDWSARNRVNGIGSGLTKEDGGFMMYCGFVHTFYDFVPPSVYKEEHPEWFNEGDYPQLCMTNDDVAKVMTKNVLKRIAENPDAKIYSVSQNDSDSREIVCKCESCMKAYEEEGAWSGVVLRLVNKVAEEVEKHYPDKIIDTLAYRWSERAPKVTKPRENVRVRICPILNCVSHDIRTCDYEANVNFRKTIKDWQEITDNLYIWHYCTNFIHYPYPFPQFDQLGTTPKYYAENGVCGIFLQGSYQGYGGAGAEIAAYMTSRILWNPDLDYKEEMNDFINGYYEEAGKYIGEYIWSMQERVKPHHLFIYADAHQPYFTYEDIKKANELFDKAERAVAGKPEILERIKMTRLQVRFAEIAHMIKHNKTENLLEMFNQFEKDCQDMGVRLSEGAISFEQMRSSIEEILAGK